MAKKRRLRSGFTTGTAAAAAASGALCLLMDGVAPPKVSVMLLTGVPIQIPIHSCTTANGRTAVCTVIKDAGDDPDVTNKAKIGAEVTLCDPRDMRNPLAITVRGGKGVGQVTKPGLDVPPGAPAINPGPMKMIRAAIEVVCAERDCNRPVTVTIFVPKGEKLAKRPLNRRLGIVGGISILGTTGLVKPMSHAAYIATIDSALRVAAAMANRQVVLTTGRRSERFAQARFTTLPEEAFIQIGDFFKRSLEKAAGIGFDRIILAVFFGKALKMAQGIPHTHAARSRLTMEQLSAWTLELTGDRILAEQVLAANTARHALELIWPAYPGIVSEVATRMVASARGFAGPGPIIEGVVFQYDGSVMFHVNRSD
ncbi:MAG: cobalt-precorrin-5B (C(1))-methyltransferase [Desulfosarcina sp.]|nr:cobalt-precorrin-5B (C(1))-methyltransferase [Desulfobacterales bacterium]